MIVASVVVLVLAAVALAVGAALGDAGIPLVWGAVGAVPVSMLLLGIGIRRFRPDPPGR